MLLASHNSEKSGRPFHRALQKHFGNKTTRSLFKDCWNNARKQSQGSINLRKIETFNALCETPSDASYENAPINQCVIPACVLLDIPGDDGQLNSSRIQ